MKSVLKANNIVVKSDVKNPLIFDANRNGDFLMFGFVNTSKYNGLFYNDNNEIYKLISQMTLRAMPKEVEVGYFPRRKYINNIKEEVIEEFNLFELGLVYKIRNYRGNIDVTLDIRKMYDFSTEGRIYNIKYKKDIIIVRYDKYNGNNIDYTVFLGIRHDGNVVNVDKWAPEFYNYDIDRGDSPDSFWTYTPFSLEIDGSEDIIIAYGKTEEDVIEKINTIYENYYSMLSEKKYMLYNDEKTRKKELSLAYWHARRTLYLLTTNNGIYAGIPWFYQYWTRDEAISLGGYISMRENLLFVKERLMNYLSSIRIDGRIPNRYPDSKLASADGVGWVFKRVFDLLLLKESDVLFTEEEKLWIYHQLEKSINSLNENYADNFLIRNNPLETWMDTSAKKDDDVDDRNGYRIEIQALMLNMYELASFLSKELGIEDVFLENYRAMKLNVKNMFFFGNVLADGKGDMTIRPNVFLAYYIFPKLLNKVEWEAVFDNALKKLWCPFGGISSIEKGNKFYASEHTGIDNVSYHRGDSWYFVNHIAAISMIMLNKRKYSKYINAIIKASEKDIISKGIIGSSSEISSCSRHEAWGCMAQAWSNSTFIELAKWKKNY